MAGISRGIFVKNANNSSSNFDGSRYGALGLTWNNYIISWYANNNGNVEGQLNTGGITYCYVGIG